MKIISQVHKHKPNGSDGLAKNIIIWNLHINGFEHKPMETYIKKHKPNVSDWSANNITIWNLHIDGYELDC